MNRKSSNDHHMAKLPTIFAVLLTFIIFIVVITEIDNFPKLNASREYKRTTNNSVNSEIKTILLWNSFFSHENWYLPNSTIGQTYFEKDNCPQTNCIVTTNGSFLKSAEDFDAVVFHASYASKVLESLPTSRKSNQIYVYANNESPALTRRGFKIPKFYNWTITYRLDSNIISHYGKVFDLATKQMVAPKPFPKWREVVNDFQLDPQTEAFIAVKTNMAAWFVSHCGAASRRDNLVKALQKYIDVDVYGRCGPLKCPRSSDLCDLKLDIQYKFYLSFENSLCTDYVTEKLFKTMEHAVVPVVYGGANYSRFAPPHSYINVEDYKSVAELAKYLIFLDKNPQEYRKYFWWKKFYKIEAHRTAIPFCDLCVSLHNSSMTNKVQFYENIEKWQSENKCRSTTAKIKFYCENREIILL